MESSLAKSSSFQEHAGFASKIFLFDLPLCRVLLENNSHYPWLLLIPRRENKFRMMDLSAADQLQLLRELDGAQKVLWEAFRPTQLNVAAIGNKTPQLHIHVVARWETDPAWPGTVWGHPVKEAYFPYRLHEVSEAIKKGFSSLIEKDFY